MEDHMMVMMRKKQSSTTSPSNSSSPLVALGMHKDSHDEFKVKPKIRIIHIFAPEIIKTDVENFRELVQRLTGKPSPSDHRGSTKKSRIPRKQKQGQQQPRNTENITKKGTDDQMVQIHQEVKEEEEEMWKSNSSNSNSNSNSNSGGFLSGFADLDGFIEELDHFSMMHPIGPNNHMLAFGESQLA